MPPKKKGDDARKVHLGRFKSNLKMGIVGLPNVGKSTFYNALTKLSVPAENYPFCTIDPSTARIPIPDDRLDWLYKHYKPKNPKQPAFLSVTDIAGLVKGAHEGEGLGAQFLSNILAVDGIFHCVRVFEDSEILHVEGEIDPVRDLQIIADELLYKDQESMERYYEGLQKIMKRGVDKKVKKEFEVAERMRKHICEDNKWLVAGNWSQDDIVMMNDADIQLLTAKPVIYLVNMSKKDYKRKKNKNLMRIKEWVDEHDCGKIIPFSAAFETEVVAMGGYDTPEGKKHCEEAGMESIIPKIVKTGFDALNLIYFFTAGEDEVKAWNVIKHSTAPEAAGTIHTDFEKYFICADVMKCEDLKEHGSEVKVKAAGKLRQQGKTYTVIDGDIMHFKCNEGSASANKKK